MATDVTETLGTVREIADFFHSFHHQIGTKEVSRETRLSDLSAQLSIRVPDSLRDASVLRAAEPREEARKVVIVGPPPQGEPVPAVSLRCWKTKVGDRDITVCIDCWDRVLCGVTIYF